MVDKAEVENYLSKTKKAESYTTKRVMVEQDIALHLDYVGLPIEEASMVSVLGDSWSIQYPANVVPEDFDRENSIEVLNSFTRGGKFDIYSPDDELLVQVRFS